MMIYKYKDFSLLLITLLSLLIVFIPSKGVIVYISYFFLILVSSWFLYVAAVFNFKFRFLEVFGSFILLLIAIPYVIFSFDNDAFFIDLKNFIMLSCFFVLFIATNKSVVLIDFNKFSNVLFYTCCSILFIYFLLFLKVFPEFYKPDELPEYLSYRVFGPSLLVFSCYLVVAYVLNLPSGRSLFVFTAGMFCAVISGSNQNVLIVLISFLPLAIKKIKFYQVCVGFALLLALSFTFQSQLMVNFTKISQIADISNSSTVLTRFADLNHAISSRDITQTQLLLGEGIGVTTEVFRDNDYGMDRRVFLEIDNGFYYVFHRFGILGLLIVIVLFSFLIYKLKDFWLVLCLSLIFLTSNLLSIHFFVTFNYLFLFWLVYAAIKVNGTSVIKI